MSKILKSESVSDHSFLFIFFFFFFFFFFLGGGGGGRGEGAKFHFFGGEGGEANFLFVFGQSLFSSSSLLQNFISSKYFKVMFELVEVSNHSLTLTLTKLLIFYFESVWGLCVWCGAVQCIFLGRLFLECSDLLSFGRFFL